MFRKILVANRGEIARRVIRAIHAVGAKAVAVYSEADADMGYLQEADERVCIGPGQALQSYLNQDAVLKAALEHDCEAVHPGYGFLAENAYFAARCEQQKLTFIGPRPEHMRLMGDKATARRTMQAAGLPVMPGSKTVMSSLQEAKDQARKIGYPVLLKATAGGGGKGMRLVHQESELESAYLSARAEAEKAFGDGGLYMEKYIDRARHIEFQVLADQDGHVVHLGERECSIQRNHQKLLEEAPAYGMTTEKRAEIGQLVCKALQQIGYLNAGTVEFLMDQAGKLYFMEMNTRIQVEHPVTELITGIDLVAWQIKIACGEPLKLKQEEIRFVGHAIEIRINAENPDANFAPSPGKITAFEPPLHDVKGPIRLETHMQTGAVVPPYYDSMVAKLIAYGQTREEAIKLLKQAAAKFKIEGIHTTLPLQQRIMGAPAFEHGQYDCHLLSQSGIL